MMKRLIVAVFVFLLPLSVLAKEAANMAADPVLEARVNALSAELRCLVCQNQTVADSHAELAVDLKNQVREMMAAGKSDKEIIDYMVQRYGDFVLFRPPVKDTTFFLWFGPLMLFLVGLVLLVFNLQRRKRHAGDDGITSDQHRKVEELLKRQEAGENK